MRGPGGRRVSKHHAGLREGVRARERGHASDELRVARSPERDELEGVGGTPDIRAGAAHDKLPVREPCATGDAGHTDIAIRPRGRHPVHLETMVVSLALSPGDEAVDDAGRSTT